MKDRFKFRFWNELRKEYENTYDLKCCEHLDYVVPEQCTGLKDNNAKLIYENDLLKIKGDIYRLAVDDFGLRVLLLENNPFKGGIEWSEFVKESFFINDCFDVEVVGNIYEDEDLLEGKE